MATINLGAIKFNWKGAYNSGTTYAVDDVVSSGGSSYVCILASTGNAVTNTTYWNIMSQAGTDGTDVGTTITTQGDILYRDASGLARLGAGTSGQALVTQGTGANPIWSTVGGTNTPAWNVYLSSNQTGISNTTFTKVQFDTKFFDTDNAYDNTTNYRLTIPSGKGGKYFVQFSVWVGLVGDNRTERIHTVLRKNGSNILYGQNQDLTSEGDSINHNTAPSSGVIEVSAGDYLEVYGYHQFNTVSTGTFGGGADKVTRFSGFKLL